MSLLITTRKELRETHTFLENPFEGYLIKAYADSSEGLSVARNRLAEKAEYSPLIFADDDVTLNKELWNFIGDLSGQDWDEKVICMAEGSHHPISRVMIMDRKAFHDIGGFDESIKHNGEDYDFYLRALKKGYYVTIIPATMIKHIPHKKGNWWRYHFESPVVRIKHHKVGFNFFFYKNPIVMLLRITGFIYYKFIKRMN